MVTAENFSASSTSPATCRWSGTRRNVFGGSSSAAPNAIVMVNAEGRIKMVKTETERVFGYGRYGNARPDDGIAGAPTLPGFHLGLRSAISSTALAARWAPDASCTAAQETATNSRSKSASTRSKPMKHNGLLRHRRYYRPKRKGEEDRGSSQGKGRHARRDPSPGQEQSADRRTACSECKLPTLKMQLQ